MRSLFAITCFAAACHGAASSPPIASTDLVLTSPSTSSFGHFVVTASGADLASFVDPITVTTGDLLAYDVTRVDATTLQLTVQGSPTPGEVPIVLADAAGHTFSSTLHFDPPVDPHFLRVAAVGASLTQGVQSYTFSVRSLLHGPAAQLARAMNAYLSLPLIKDELMPQITAADFDPTSCQLKEDPGDLILNRALMQTLPALMDDTGFHPERARLDPHAEVRDVAIGGFHLADMLSGITSTSPTSAYSIMVEHIVWDPFLMGGVGAFDNPQQTMVDRIVALQPTLVVSMDLYINDLDAADLGTSGIPDLSALTTSDAFQASLDALLAQLDSTSADYFIGDAPDLTMLQKYADKVAQLRHAGYEDAEATGWLATIRAHTDDFNARLVTAAATHPRLHVVPVAQMAKTAFTSGVVVGNARLTTRHLGGLLSFDDIHFSDTGYAVLAQTYADAINAALGTHIPKLDLRAVLADDPYSIEALHAEGLYCDRRVNPNRP